MPMQQTEHSEQTQPSRLPSSTQQLPEHVETQRRWVESLNRGDVSGADAIFAPNCVIHATGNPDLNVAGFKEMLIGFLTAFPDVRFTMQDHVVSGDTVAFRWTAEGTNTGPLGAAPPTGKRVRIDGLLFDRYADGRVVERWEQWDQPAMLAQLGFA